MFRVMAHRVVWRTGTNVSRKEHLWWSRQYVRTKRSCARMRMYGAPSANFALWIFIALKTWEQKTSLRSRRIAFRRSFLSPSSRNNLIGNKFDVNGSTPPVGLGLIVEVSRSYSDTSRSVGLFWARDRPDAETSTWLHTTLKRQISMLPTGFEPTIPAGKRSQTHALDRAATGIGRHWMLVSVLLLLIFWYVLVSEEWRYSPEFKK